ncbi:hypothetical protein HY375_01960 [Candidatus Berkelbacteria bacterium]|nr:hypothetical protein [Candidatus Berkelbacteria bacterium]
MDPRKVTLLRSVLSLVAVVALGGGVTYALFTSNQVTVSQTQVTTGSADLKICNSLNSTPAGSNTWKTSVSPLINFDGISPGDSDVDISTGVSIYVGNDGGQLQDNLGAECNSYDATVTAGSSTVDMKMVPVVTATSCPNLSGDLQLRFGFDGTFTAYKTITNWGTNTSALGPTFAVDDAKLLAMQAKLANGVTLQDENCTFDVNFTGEQV